MDLPTQTIEVICPQCQAALTVPVASAGATITCSDCLEDFVASPVPNRPGPLTAPGHSAIGPADDGDDALQRLLNPNLDTSPADRGTIRLEDDSQEEVYPTKKRQVLASDYEFSVACVICGTRLDVNDSLIGKKIKCPDCHNAIEVRTPPPDRRRAPVHAESAAFDDDEDFGLAKVSDTAALSSPYHTIANDLMAQAESEAARAAPTVPRPRPRPAPALDALQRADASRDEDEQQERPKLPAAPFRTGVLTFLFDPVTIARLIVLALVLFVELGAIQLAITSAEGPATSQFVSVLFRMLAVTLGAVFGTNLAVSLLGILQDTANGKDTIESWPDINFLEWIGEAFYLFSAIFIAVFPACVAAKLISAVGAGGGMSGLVAIGGIAVGFVFLFPFALLSMLESGSPIAPVSQPIIRSLRLASGNWVVFTLLTILLVGVGVCLGAVRVWWPDSSIMNFIIALVLIVVFSLYFRLLGRLTWCCDEAVLAEDIRLEEAAEAAGERG